MKNKTLLLYIHGKGGTAEEAEHYVPLFPDCDVVPSPPLRPLTVMEDGEHWFHTPSQMKFLDNWIKDHRKAITYENS